MEQEVYYLGDLFREDEKYYEKMYYLQKSFDVNIAPLVVSSWLMDKYKKRHLYPVVRDQLRASNKYTCAHHSLCPSLEVRNKRSWDATSRMFRKYKESRIDVEFLIKLCPPPSHPKTIIDAVIHNYEGLIPCESGHSTKKAKEKSLSFSRINSWEEKLDIIVEITKRIDEEGPIVAGFPSSKFKGELSYLKEGFVEVYDAGRKMYVMVDGVRYRSFHGVCITGTAVGNHMGNLDVFFQYLDSDGPTKTVNKDGVRFVAWSIIDTIVIPNVKQRKKSKKADIV